MAATDALFKAQIDEKRPQIVKSDVCIIPSSNHIVLHSRRPLTPDPSPRTSVAFGLDITAGRGDSTLQRFLAATEVTIDRPDRLA